MREDLGRTPLPQDVPPSDELTIEMRILPGLVVGRYTLRYDMKRFLNGHESGMLQKK